MIYPITDEQLITLEPETRETAARIHLGPWVPRGYCRPDPRVIVRADVAAVDE